MSREISASGLTRRALLAAASAMVLPAQAGAVAVSTAIIDWGLLEAALALGAPPVAATELIQYRKLVVDPVVPADVADLGLRGTPNYELLRMIAPARILISGFYEYQRAGLERIAPVLSLPVYEAGKPPYPLAETAMRRLGALLGKSIDAERYIAETRTILSRANAELAPIAARPAFVISLGDSRHFRAFGADSMFGDVLGRLGLANAWTDQTSYSAAAPVGIEALARAPEASIVIVAPMPPEVARGLPDNAIWNALPAVRENRVALLDPINHFGGLPSARRFARLMVAAFSGRHG